MGEKRTPGIVLLGLLLVLAGIAGSVFFGAELFYPAAGHIGNITWTIISIIFFVAGSGLLLLKKWARYLALCIALGFFTHAVASFFITMPSFTRPTQQMQFAKSYSITVYAAQLLLTLFVLIYLTRPNVAKRFR